ncbi:hypothetical protein D3C79_733510 [compost metagenome]
MPFIGVTNSNAVIGECPELFDQAILQLFDPFTLQESPGLVTPTQELCTISPVRILAVGQRDLCGITAVPTIFSQTHLAQSRLTVEWREGRTYFTV